MPAIPEGRELFNEVMSGIEPDLVMDDAALAAKYVNESETEKTARLARYELAFAEYDVQVATKLGALRGEVHGTVHALQRGVETDSRTKEQDELSALESSMDTAA